jgi:hypothetical protein
MTDKEAMKLALEALETCTPQDTSTGHVIYAWHDEELVNKAIKALEEALAKQEQGEPVAHINQHGVVHEAGYEWWGYGNELTPLYTTPQQRKPLTDEQTNKAAMKLAECMDYPWTFMTEEGKREMRKHATAVIETANGIKD